MNKTELASAMAKKTGMSKKDCENALTAMLDVITDTLRDGDKLTLVGFGTFDVAERKARTGHNPGTGEEISIPATRVPVFKPGKDFKDAVKSAE